MAYSDNDILLYTGESNPNDVRLRDPNATTAITTSVTASTESYAIGALAESFSLSVTAATETKAGAVMAEALSLAVTAGTETKASVVLAESFALALAAVTETPSASVLVETFGVLIQAVTETFAAASLAEVTNVDATITAGTETGADASAGVQNPAIPVRTAAGGPTGTKHRKRFLFPEPEPEFAEAAFTPSKPWAPDSDVPDDELLEVFAMMVNEDLF